VIPAGLAVNSVDRDTRDRSRVVFVHGVMDRAASFWRSFRRLDRYHLAAYDRRGYAASTDLGPATAVADHVSDLVAVLGGRPSTVVGHSFGGLIALQAAYERPDLIEAVAVYEPPVGWLLGNQRPPALVDTTGDPADVAEAFFLATVGERTWLRSPPGVRSARRAEGPAIIADLEFASSGTSFDLGDLAVPVRVGHGLDAGGRYRLGAQRLAEKLPDARLDNLEPAGHGIHLSHPDRFARWITDLVDNLAR
jgi:pimeloyl-ACP methyl ester carboxylesterase